MNKIKWTDEMDNYILSKYKEESIITMRKNLGISQVPLIRRMKELGIFPRKTGKEILPEYPHKFLSSILLGLFDGDGSIYKNSKGYKIFSLCSASKTFLEQCRQSTLNFGGIYPSNKIWRWDIIKKDHILQIRDYMYSNSNFSLSRKKERFYS